MALARLARDLSGVSDRPLTPRRNWSRYLDSLHRNSIDAGGLVQVANRRDPRATRSAPTSDGAARVGGACLPTWASPGWGSGGGVDSGTILPAAPAIITIQERRSADGLDAHVPIILRDGSLYNADLDRFFLDLPLNGVRSPHSLRAYGYDVMLWVRFLEEACGKSVWNAARSDVAAFHRARRREDAGARISAASWNRSVAALEKLYRWAELENLVASSPFTHRDVWRRGHSAYRARVVARNDAYERAAKRSDVRFVSLEDYRVFRDVGLRGLTSDGAERRGARDRNGARNALFAELLVMTGLRLEEASFLLALEFAGLAQTRRRRPPSLVRTPVSLDQG